MIWRYPHFRKPPFINQKLKYSWLASRMLLRNCSIRCGCWLQHFWWYYDTLYLRRQFFFVGSWRSQKNASKSRALPSIPIVSMYAIYGNIYHQYTPFMLAYIPYIRILWDRKCQLGAVIGALKGGRYFRGMQHDENGTRVHMASPNTNHRKNHKKPAESRRCSDGFLVGGLVAINGIFPLILGC